MSEAEALAYGEVWERVADLADETCDGRLIAVLEGGYDPSALARSVAATVRGAYDDPPGWEYAGGVRPVDGSRAALAPFWKALR